MARLARNPQLSGTAMIGLLGKLEAANRAQQRTPGLRPRRRANGVCDLGRLRTDIAMCNFGNLLKAMNHEMVCGATGLLISYLMSGTPE
jgi:hypothetical protein